MAEQVGKFLTELPELETPTDGDLMYIVDDETTSKKVTMANLKRVLGGNVTGTVEGASVSFSDGADGIPMKECEVTLVPSQDLHGYSKPWAGGSGKNKLPLTVANIKASNTSGTWSGNVYSISNCTFEILTDNDSNVMGIKVNTTGTASQNISFNVGKNLNYIEEMIFSGCPSGGSTNTYMMYTASPERYDTGNGITIQYTSVFNAYIYIKGGYAPNNLIFYPMLRLSTESSRFEPYSNICPISGHTDVTVTVASTSGGSGEDTTVSLGRTVYGGTLNLDTGELIVTHGIVDLGTLNFTKTTQYGYTYFTGSPITNKKLNSICSDYAAVKKARNALNNGEIGTHNTTNSFEPCIRDDTKADLTDEQFKTAMNGVQLVYELATPQTFTLTPTQVKTLLGQNYVSHDGGGNIKVVYIRDLDITINDLIDRVTALENE